MNRRVLVVVALSVIVTAGCGGTAGPASTAVASTAADAPGPVLPFTESRLAATADGLAPPNYPVRTNPDGTWLTKGPDDWTSGFLPATLWRTYERTHDPVWRERAERWTAPLRDEVSHDDGDLGFKMFMTFAVAHQLTGDRAAEQTALAAADTVARRFQPAVGMIRMWDDWDDPGDVRVNIDAMMNLELLYWAGQHGRPQYTAMATRHAERSMQDLVRPDGSTFQFGAWNRDSGELLRQYTEQGARDDSTWSRGQGWAIYGFTMAYRYTHDERFLDTARRTADWFVGHLPPDHVPYWDFDVPQDQSSPRDSSAAAVAASGMLELSTAESDPARRDGDVDAARAMLGSLASPAYLSRGTPNRAILQHGTQNVPEGQQDSGIQFGDYYFVEALHRYERLVGPTAGLRGP